MILNELAIKPMKALSESFDKAVKPMNDIKVIEKQ